MPQVFDAPIPGQSLTKPPGATKWEKPPQFIEEQEALEWLWGKLLLPEGVGNIIVLLKNGVSVFEMASTLLYAGIADGRWSLDLAYQMMQETTWMIEAIANKSGVKEYEYKKPKASLKKFVGEYAEFLAEPTKEEKKITNVFTGLV
jgi:hypothetical protein